MSEIDVGNGVMVTSGHKRLMQIGVVRTVDVTRDEFRRTEIISVRFDDGANELGRALTT